MTILLAIESSAELASIALTINGQLTSRELSGVHTHSQNLLPSIQSLLFDAGISLNQCDAIAFDCGPGAFTGVRTACGIVQGLAYAANLPVVPVVSLHAMALSAIFDSDDTEVVSMLDARMGEVYWARYRVRADACLVLTKPSLVNIGQINTLNLADATLVFGNGISLDNLGVTNTNAIHQMPHASLIAKVGLLEFAAGRALAAHHAQPLYVRNKIASTTAERLLAKDASQ
jgi:tRNA threonylcarbamoyladenosine biosynthesis protein TsaB